MYDTKFICTYNTNMCQEMEHLLKDMNNNDKEFFRESLYRQELLNIFGIEEYDEKNIDKFIHELYEKLKYCEELKECMVKLASYVMSTDEEIGLIMLFAYDYMYLSHICISEFLETGKITKDNISKLKLLIF
jgi:hypothetical protein